MIHDPVILKTLVDGTIISLLCGLLVAILNTDFMRIQSFILGFIGGAVLFTGFGFMYFGVLRMWLYLIG